MCLSEVKLALAGDQLKYGYKAIDIIDGKMRGTDFFKDIRKGVWLKSNKPLVVGEKNDTRYLAGFHIFLNKEDAADYCYSTVIVKFEYRGVLAYGTQFVGKGDALKGFYRPCLVVDEIKFVEICK
jgi:hypothetical protein